MNEEKLKAIMGEDLQKFKVRLRMAISLIAFILGLLIGAIIW